jgi:primosomal protein N' (replication factor Y)
MGTEKVADALGQRFGDANIGRLDRDVATGANIGKVLDRVARREIDILVGTQMVTKGHDFPGVTLVGVLLADTGLSLPDFRAAERTFQLLTQVAGRAGRGERAGRVLIQSYRPDIEAVAAAAQHDYEGFYRAEIASRRELGYPPFGHLVAVRVDGPNPREVEALARRIGDRARALIASTPPDESAGQPISTMSVLGPSEAPLARLKGRTRWHVWLRADSRHELRRLLRATMRPDSIAAGGRTRITIDVDPISAL